MKSHHPEIQDDLLTAELPDSPVRSSLTVTHTGGDITPSAVVGSNGNGTLTVFGDTLDNAVTLSRNAAGTLLVNGGAVAVTGATPTVANTALIQVFGQAGNDVLTLSETNGALPRANLFGGAGNDVLTGGSGADLLFGQADNDTLLGKGGNDSLFGGQGNDVLTGGDGDDQMFGESGDDRFIWNPGDDTDLAEGGDGIDTVEVNGGNGAESFTVTPNGTRVRVDRLNPAPFAIDAGTVERIVINANGGDDVISAYNGLASLVQLTIDGGTGNDTITGGDGNDFLLGGEGNDLITGGRGNDVAFLGAGNDTFVWNPGDNSDTVEGQDGSDTLQFNGANVGETIDIAANGQRVRFARNVASIVMDLNGVEHLRYQALGGADVVNVADLSGTGVADVAIDLNAFGGGGDLAADTVVTTGTNGNDHVDIFGAGSSVAVVGLSATVNITGSEGAQDRLVVNTLGGNDVISAATMPAGVTQLTIDAGAGNDIVNGSQGADLIFGGDGNDTVTGDNGNDTLFLGAGDDTAIWTPGDGNDTVEGQDGNDRLLVVGSNASERVDIVANGGRVLFARDVASVTLDVNGVERLQFDALGGNDTVTVGDLTGTHVQQVQVNLTGPVGGGDAATDTVVVNGSNAREVIVVNTVGGEHRVTGIAAEVRVNGADTGDVLRLNANGGDDFIDASGATPNTMQIELNGGLGHDVLIGSNGNDLFNGGDGNDTALMGAGDDTFVWNPGDDNDVVEGQAGTDTLRFNGANIAENINILANGGRVLFTRDVANVVMDLNEVEVVRFQAQGGADNITVGDMSGTALTRTEIDLAATGTTAGDGTVDTVTVNGTNGNDIIRLTMENGALVVSGLQSRVVIEHFDPTDVLRILGLGGNDVIDASALGTNAPLIVMDGGTGDDVLIGGAGNDQLQGGDGNDVLLGGAGNDVLAGGAGADVMLGGLGLNSFQSDAGDTVINGGAPFDQQVLQLQGSEAANTLSVSRNAAGQILFNGVLPAGAPTIANTGHIELVGLGGNDTITLSEVNGALPSASLFGNAGNDVITGGSGADQVFGGADHDTLLGKGGNDMVFGGTGNDVITGGDGDDQLFGEEGNDRFVWNPGDDTDMVEGGAGTDTLEVNGGNGAETFAITPNGTRVRFDRTTPAPFSVDAGTIEQIVVHANGGDDIVTASNGLSALVQLTIDGGTGNDIITGGDGADLLLGGDGHDVVTGGRGADTALLGAGDDRFVWNPGDGSDVVEGQDGRDALTFNGANVSETIDISANGARARMTRDVANVVMDLNDVERIDFQALGGNDRISVHDMSATDVRLVNLDLAGTIGGIAGDGSVDSVTIDGTAGNDIVTVSGGAASRSVIGLAAEVDIVHAEAFDGMNFVLGAGDNQLDLRNLGGDVRVSMLGGAGRDLVRLGTGDMELRIGDFQAGAGLGDRVDLRGLAGTVDFQWVLSHTTDFGSALVVDLGNGGHLQLDGVSLAQLNADDFIFDAPLQAASAEVGTAAHVPPGDFV